MSDCTCKYCTQDRRDDAIASLRLERDSLRARVAELEGAFAEFKAMLKAAGSQRFDIEIQTQWLVELPMTHEQVAIWDKHMNPQALTKKEANYG